MRIALRCLLALMALLLAVFACTVVGLTVFVTGPRVEGWLAQALERRTGAQLVFESEGRVRVFPHLTVQLPASRVMRPGEREPLVSLGPVTARVSPWAMFLGQIRIRQFDVESAQVRAWPQLVARSQAGADAAGTRSTSASLAASLLRLSVHVGTLRVGSFSGPIPGLGTVQGATLVAEGVSAGSVRRVQASGRAALPFGEGAFTAAAAVERSGMRLTALAPDVYWQDARLQARLRAGSIGVREGSVKASRAGVVALAGSSVAALECTAFQRGADGAWRMSGTKASYHRDGKRPVAVELRGEPSATASGTGSVQSLSGTAEVRGLAHRTGRTVVPLGGQVTWTGATLYADLMGSIDGQTATLKGKAELSGRPALQADLAVSQINLESWMDRPHGIEPAPAPESAAGAPAPLPMPALAQAPAAQPAALPFDLKGSLSVARVLWRKASLSDALVRFETQGNALALPSLEAALAGGRVTGSASLSRTGGWTLRLKGQDLSAAELARQFGGKPRLEGAAGISADLSGHGSSILDASGTASVRMPSADWTGFSLENLARAVASRSHGRPDVASGKTHLSGLAADFQLRSGVLESDNLKASCEMAAVAGRVRWQLASGQLEGTVTATVDPANSAVPVSIRVAGTAGSPRLRVDWSGTLGSLLGVAPQEPQQEASDEETSTRPRKPGWLRRLRNLFRSTH